MNIKLLLKNKRILWVILAVAVVFSLFFLKTKSVFKNEASQATGLVYNGNETIDELVNKDTDKDGVLDWEESLWGTDPTKVDTNGDGVSDSVEIAKLKGSAGTNAGSNVQEEENLTATDKFSRELFSTVVTLNQAGRVDQDTVDQFSASLAEQINNSIAKKIFSFSDIKTTTDNSAQAIQNYNNTLDALFRKSPTLYKNKSSDIVYSIHSIFADVFQKFLSTGNDERILSELDPAIKELRVIVDGMSKVTVPTGLSVLHLEAINSLERVSENLNDLKLIEGDPIIAMGAASSYKENITYLEEILNKLAIAISQKLSIR